MSIDLFTTRYFDHNQFSVWVSVEEGGNVSVEGVGMCGNVSVEEGGNMSVESMGICGNVWECVCGGEWGCVY